MNTGWLVQRSHLSLMVQNSVHSSERELVITDLQGSFIEYCFRETRQKLQKQKEETVAENELQLEGWSIV